MGSNPSNKSIIGAALAGEEAFTESEESDRRPFELATGALLSWLEDNMSNADVLLCAGGDAPIDNRSSRTSVPAFEGWLVPKWQDKIKLFNQQ